MTSQSELRALTLIRSTEIMGDMETEQLKKIAAAASEVEFSGDEVVYDEGELGKAVYIIRSGQVVVEMNVPGQGYITIHTLGPGQLFGWSSLFPSQRKGARARTIKPTRAIAINANQLRAAWQTDHALENAIIQRTARVMIDRIKSTRQQLVNALAEGEKK